MPEVGERELLAILFTDAVDSTARTASDEENSLKNLLADLEYIRTEADSRGGTVLKNTGDGLLISFKSAVDAMECAISVQNTFTQREDKTFFKHKISLHLGDVIKKNGDIFGNGVNIASRLLAQCNAGSICFSSNFYELVKQKEKIGKLRLQEFQLKNVNPPIRAFSIDNYGRITLDRAWRSACKLYKKTNKIFLFLIFILLAIIVIPFVLKYNKQTLNNKTKEIIKKTLAILNNQSTEEKDKEKTFQGDKIIGTWKAKNDDHYFFYIDGTVRKKWASGYALGNFSKNDTDEYILNFNQNQWLETLKINQNSLELEGATNFGDPITAVKISEAVSTDDNRINRGYLSGVWRNTAIMYPARYYLYQKENKVFWYGEEKEKNPKWAHIFAGEIKDNQIIGEMYDLPKGKIRETSRIIAILTSSNEITIHCFLEKNKTDKEDFTWTIIKDPL